MEIKINAEVSAKLNYAAYQSQVPLLHDLRVENLHTTQYVEDLVLTLTTNPAFVQNQQWFLDRIAPQGVVSIPDREPEINSDFLLNCTESMRGEVVFQVNKGEFTLAKCSKPIEILAYNEWGGGGFKPELLAAFSMPNDPAIDRVLRNASDVLRRHGKNDQIDGYQSGSRKRVWEIVSAIYTAIANLNLAYAVPPASFEQNGQKIRLPAQILDSTVATCLDTAMLFASVFEQAGLNPIVALPKGHAIVGVWLQPDSLPTIVIEEVETLRKRIDLDELVLVETTCVTSHPTPTFSSSHDQAKDTIGPASDDTFIAAVDIQLARKYGVKPLSLISGQTIPGSAPSPATVSEDFEVAPELPDFDDANLEEKIPDTPQGRVERWKRKLLDLTLHNGLLNHRKTKATVRLICHQPGVLEDKLAENKKIRLRSLPAFLEEGQSPHNLVSAENTQKALEAPLPSVLVDISEEELNERTVLIYRKAQTSLQEGGANTLYLALGFLVWKKKAKDNRSFRAPLILLPVALERESVRSGIRMVAHDDEPRFNTTLLEMLSRDFDIKITNLDGDLPRDDSGIDVDKIWNKVRRAIKNVPGFEVVTDVVLGHFFFAKYLMWKDLEDQSDALRNNPVVRHLIDTPLDSYRSDIEFFDSRQLDSQFNPHDLLVPMEADSSQMTVIATAEQGKDFILIGPPGTGKSQTISNLIAHMLGKGKTVLFVSEKTAALEVVYRRLKTVGLDAYCLQLHSNKTKKSDVLEQLSRSLYSDGNNSPSKWRKCAEELKILRDTLNQVVQELHSKYSNGWTIYQAMGVKIRDESIANKVTLSWPTTDNHNEQMFLNLEKVVDNLSFQAEIVSDLKFSTYRLITTHDWGMQWEREIVERAGELELAAERAQHAYDDFCGMVGIEFADRSIENLEALGELASLLVKSHRMSIHFAIEQDGARLMDALIEAAVRLNSYIESQASLSCDYAPFAWKVLDGEDIGRRWVAADKIWWPKRIFVRRSIVKEICTGGANGMPNPAHDADVIMQLRLDGETIDGLDKQLSRLKEWNGYKTDPVSLQLLHRCGEDLRSLTGKLAEDSQKKTQLRKKIGELLKENSDLLSPEGSMGNSANTFIQALQHLQQAGSRFDELSGGSVRTTFASSDQYLGQLREATGSMHNQHDGLRDWCMWIKRKEEAVNAGLSPLVKALEDGQVGVGNLKQIFEVAYCAWWSEAVIEKNQVLRNFSVPEHMRTIKNFRDTDKEFQEITARYIAAKLATKNSQQNDNAHDSQRGILHRELQKRTRHKPIRRLLEEAPDAVTSLAPCFMMSPLSVAQYLSPGQAQFDIVIFDEASQITVWDAIGSLARGKQIIVAGDPKQMPPTNFFSRTDDDSQVDDDSEVDLESILDEMRGARIPELKLNLHYRSQHESLIAFSNSRYYENGLITFPSPAVDDNALRLVRPSGFYARGQARHNEGEAKAIVAEILRRLTHEDSDVRNRTIGVVTFNSPQQTLILNLLDEERRKQPQIEWAFSSKKEEPVFVKNLETVQGDERDVILFSITYGPNQSGYTSMNFGPLNRSGGERRLNVAMTRARCEIIVFSTLDPSQIDLSRTSAHAVKDLKHFLEYAQSGKLASRETISGSQGDFESPFEAAVAQELHLKHWRVVPQVGVSAYRIDLGVVHPDEPGRYLAGIECDGAMYHSSATARERDKIRQQVLERQGWSLFRIWSTDWWLNKPKALETVHNDLRERLEDDRRTRRLQEPEKTVAGTSDEKLVTTTHSTLTPDGPENDHLAPSSRFTEDAMKHPTGSAQESGFATAKQDEVVDKNSTSDMNAKYIQSSAYVYADSNVSRMRLDPEAFYGEEYRRKLSELVDIIIDTEGPIHEDILVRRIARYHGFSRAGSKIRGIVLKLATRRRGKSKEKSGTFFLRKGTVNDRMPPARIQGRDKELRNFKYICADEIRTINNVTSSQGDAVAIARVLGIGRLSSLEKARIEGVVTRLSSD